MHILKKIYTLKRVWFQKVLPNKAVEHVVPILCATGKALTLDGNNNNNDKTCRFHGRGYHSRYIYIIM